MRRVSEVLARKRELERKAIDVREEDARNDCSGKAEVRTKGNLTESARRARRIDSPCLPTATREDEVTPRGGNDCECELQGFASEGGPYQDASKKPKWGGRV